MATKRLVTQLEQEKTVLIEQIAELRRSVDELSHKKSLMLDELQDVAGGTSQSQIIIDELLIEVEDDLSVAFDDYFATEDSFVAEIRKSLLEG